MKKLLLLILFLVIVQKTASSQIISGKVIDQNQNVLPYANIGVVGFDIGTISQSDGSYSIDISNVKNEEIIRVSYVGYESISIKVGELKRKEKYKCNITLKKKRIELNEVIIDSNKDEPFYIGAKKRGRMAWVWSENKKGAEIGTLFKISKPVYLNKLFFHVKKNYCDSIYYRLRIYDGKDEMPLKIINNEDIKFISRIEKGWESIDVSNYNIKLEKDVILTLETLESWITGEPQLTHLSLSNKNKISFSRATSTSEWIVFWNEMSFKIEVSE